mgnify:CR=1 FL=1
MTVLFGVLLLTLLVITAVAIAVDMVHEGLIHYIGCCNFTAWQIVTAQERAEQNGFERFVTVQPQYNLLARDIELELMPLCIDREIGLLPWSPLGGGWLTGKYRRGEPPPDGSRVGRADRWDDLPEQR